MTEMDFTTAFVDSAGYEELRKHIRESTQFTKEIALVLEERAKVEMNYAKLLNALTVKASKITRTNSGTLSAAWSVLCGQFDAEATVHKTMADTLMKDLNKPLKKMAEQQAKSYKLFETPVDKALKSMNDSRADLSKKKKNVYAKSKESQTLVGQVGMSTNAKGKPISEKEMDKIKVKAQKSEETVAKTEAEYMKQVLLAERSRQQYEVALIGAASTVQKQEVERINQQKALLHKYSQTIWDMTPKIQTCCESINRALTTVQPEADVTAIAKAKGKPPQPTYQVLLDGYQEDPNNMMSVNQRKEYAKRQVKLIDDEINREMKRQEEMFRNQRNASTKGAKDGKTDARMQMMHSNDTINMLTASKFKLLSSIADMDGQNKPVSEMAQFIRVNKDKSGATVSTLHYPRAGAPNPDSARRITGSPSLAIVVAAQPAVTKSAPPAAAVAATTATVVAQQAPAPVPPQQQGLVEGGAGAAGAAAAENGVAGVRICTALYDFKATEEEHLAISEGDSIKLLEADDDGWWKGEMGGRVGIFPASYVKVEEE